MRRLFSKVGLNKFKDPFTSECITTIHIKGRNNDHPSNWLWRNNPTYTARIMFETDSTEATHEIKADSLELLNAEMQTFITNLKD